MLCRHVLVLRTASAARMECWWGREEGGRERVVEVGSSLA